MSVKKAKPKNKPRRVVLGVGHPWFYFSPGCIGLTETPVSDSLLLRSFDWKEIDTGGLSNHNKVRLVLEVLE